MRFERDENLPQLLAPVLAGLGHDLCTTAEEGLLGKRDEDVGAAAAQESRMVFSLDLDFADLRKFPPGPHPGIVVFRPRSMGPFAVRDFVLAFASGTDLSHLASCVAIVEPGRVRVRRPPLDTDGPEWRDVSV